MLYFHFNIMLQMPEIIALPTVKDTTTTHQPTTTTTYPSTQIRNTTGK